MTSELLSIAVALAVGLLAGGTIVALLVRRRSTQRAAERGGAPVPPDSRPTAALRPAPIPDPTSAPEPAPGPPSDADPAADVGVGVGGSPVTPRVAQPATRGRVVATSRTPAPAPPVVRALSDVAAGVAGGVGADTARDVADEERDGSLIDVLHAVRDGGVVALRGSGPTARTRVLRPLLAVLGERPFVEVALPGRHDTPTGLRVHEPLRDVLADLATLTARPGTVLLIDEAELHLRRGLDRAAIERITQVAPTAVIVALVGPSAHDAIVDDDPARWLDGLVRAELGLAPEEHDPELDGPLLAAADTAPLLVDLVEAAAYARAAGRLPEVPCDVVVRLATGLAGGDPEASTAAVHVLGALAADDAVRRLLTAGAPQHDGLPTTLAAPARIAARCTGDVEVLGTELLVRLLVDADPVEQLLVVRHLIAGDEPHRALPVLDTLVREGGPVGDEAQLLRGVARDRLELDSAQVDYEAVAARGDIDLAPHAWFLLGGVREMAGDEDGARAAYRHAVASGHPLHAAMARFNLAWLDERTGDVGRAVDEYRELAADGHPEAGPLAALNLATLLERTKRYAEAESWFRVAIDSEHPDAWPMAALMLGLMLERRQRPREARVLFRRAAGSGHEEAVAAALRRLGAPRR